MAGEERHLAKVKHDCWLMERLVVKILAKDLKAQGFYKKKGEVVKVLRQPPRFVGELYLPDDDATLQVDQAHLETVLPQPGGSVLVVNGGFRGEEALLLGIDEKRFQARVRIKGGVFAGKELWLDYEWISKFRRKA